MKAKLVVISGGVTSTEINLLPPVVLGRGRQAGITLPHSLISRQHCEIYEVDGQLVVRDLGSMNGTLVNRAQIEQPTVLHPGDSLTIGPVTFRVDYVDATTTRSDTSDETAIASKAQVDPQPPIPKNGAADPTANPAAASSSWAVPSPSAPSPDPPSTVFDVPATESAVPADDDGLDDFLRNLK